MNECRSDDRKGCYYHIRESVIGICPLCLNERLLVLANSKQGHLHQSHKTLSVTTTTKKTPLLVLTKIFALTNLLNRLDIKRQKHADDQFCHSSSTSPEDSFISIKFGDNGVASWEKGKSSKISHDQQCEMSKAKKIKSLVEHGKPRPNLRWRKRVGHLFHLIRWKRSNNKGNMCHVGTKTRRSKAS